MHIRVFPDGVTRCIRQKITFISRQHRAGEAIDGDLPGFPAARRSDWGMGDFTSWQALHKTCFPCQ
jgi:hypothetical protein